MSMTIIVIVTKNVSDNFRNIVQIYFHKFFLVNDNSCHFDKTMSITILGINKFILAVKTRNKRICSQNLSLTQDKLRTRLVRNHEVIIFTVEIHFTRLYFANVSMKSILVLLTGDQG